MHSKLAPAVLLAALCLLLHPARLPAEMLEKRDFRLAKNGQDHVVLSLAEAGTLVVRARVKPPYATAAIRLLLEGPGGLRVEKEGPAPLRLRYAVADPTAGDTWRASVISASSLPNVIGRLSVELQPALSGARQPAAEVAAAAGKPALATLPGATDGKVTIIDDRRLRAACRDRNLDVSLRLNLEHGTGNLLMRFHPVFSLTVNQLSDDRIEMRGSGGDPLYLDLDKKAIFFASARDGAFCRVRIYRQGEE